MPEAPPCTLDPFTLAEALEAGVVVHDADTAIRYANPKALELLHLTWDQALGKLACDPCWQFLDAHGQPMPIAEYPVSRVIRDRATIRDQVIGIVHRDGGPTMWVRVCAYPEADGGNTIAQVVVTFVDVTARVRSERLRQAQLDIALQSNVLGEEQLLQRVLSWCEEVTSSTISFFHFVNDDQETIELVTWSERTLHEYCRVAGLNRHYPISEAGIWAESFRKKRPVVVNEYAEATNKHGLPDGHAHLERFISMPLLEGDRVRVLLGVGNKPYAYAGDDVQDLSILTDQVWRIVAQKRSEIRARDLAQAVEQTPASIVMTDKGGIIQYINPAFTEITGYNKQDVEGKSPNILKSGETPEYVYADLWSTISTGRTWNNRLRNRRKDGSSYWTNMIISALRDEKNQIIGFLGIGEDVTERVKLEEQVRHAQKMEALGQLTGGVAHDFNNLLGIIRGNLDLLQEATGNRRQQSEILREVLETVETGSALTRRLLAFSRRQPLTARPSDLGQLVSNLEDLFRRTLGEKIEVRHRAAPGLWAAAVDPHELEHVLLNLVLNARDAMPDGGVLTIETNNVSLDEEYASQFEEVLPGDYVLLAVSDTGTGMPADVLERAFDPFFTTKETGKGSGLGLSVAYGFAKQSRGHIRLYSEVAHGTTVKLFLPRAGWAEPATRASQPEARPSPASARILLVEDNPRLRRITSAMLVGHGYAVVEAADGPEALLRLGDAGPFQLMITDVGLPSGMNGVEVAAVARMREPSLQVLYMSGYAEPAVLQNHEAYHLISKPFGRNELMATVGSLLSADRVKNVPKP